MGKQARKPNQPKELCGATKKRGGTCRKGAGWGTPNQTGRCKLHGGMTPSHQKHAEKAQALKAAEKAVLRFGLRRDIAPHEALLEAVHTSAALVAGYESILDQIDQAMLVKGVTKTIRLPNGRQRVEAAAARSVWLVLYNEERDRLVRASRDAINCGVAERAVEIAQEQAQQIAAVVSAILIDLGHDLADQSIQQVVRLRLIQGGRAA